MKETFSHITPKLFPVDQATMMKCRRLARSRCANYDKETGCCWILDDTCPLFTSLTRCNCKYFRESVLPEDPDMFKEIVGVKVNRHKRKTCNECGAEFLSRSNSQKYCLACSEKVRLRRQREYMRKKE